VVIKTRISGTTIGATPFVQCTAKSAHHDQRNEGFGISCCTSLSSVLPMFHFLRNVTGAHQTTGTTTRSIIDRIINLRGCLMHRAAPPSCQCPNTSWGHEPLAPRYSDMLVNVLLLSPTITLSQLRPSPPSPLHHHTPALRTHEYFTLTWYYQVETLLVLHKRSIDVNLLNKSSLVSCRRIL